MKIQERLHSDKEFEIIDGVAVPKQKKVDKASPARTIAKTISWRIVASITTFIIFYVTTGEKIAAGIIGAAVGVEAITKMAIYYVHERLWENVNWGKYWMRYGLIRRIKLNYIMWRRKKKSKKTQ
jgi:uncharacterized membrane protein